jgi:hypothetical protein
LGRREGPEVFIGARPDGETQIKLTRACLTDLAVRACRIVTDGIEDT